MFIFGSIGVVDTLYLVYHKVRGTDVACPFFPKEWCHKVQHAPQSKTFGIPNSVAGLVMYIVILTLAHGFYSGSLPLWPLASLIVFGFLFSLYFLYVQAFVLRAFCTWCVLSFINFTVMAIAICIFYFGSGTLATNIVGNFDGRNATFSIDGRQVTLKNGVSEEEAAPGSASKIITRYFGNEARGDLNFDGREDRAFLVTQEAGGSGFFYYAVAAIQTDSGYKTTNAFFVGDRIAPQPTYIPPNSGEIQVNYADRNEGEPMTAPLSRGVTLLLKVTPEGVLEGLMK